MSDVMVSQNFIRASFKDCALVILYFHTRRSNSSHKCSLGLRSGDWGGEWSCCGTWYSSHSFTITAVCLRWLSCWKIQEFPSCKAWMDGCRFSRNMFKYLNLSIMPSINTSLPTPDAAIEPQTITCPLPRLTVGTRVTIRMCSFAFLHTLPCPSHPNILYLLSSVNSTVFGIPCIPEGRILANMFFSKPPFYLYHFRRASVRQQLYRYNAIVPTFQFTTNDPIHHLILRCPFFIFCRHK